METQLRRARAAEQLAISNELVDKLRCALSGRSRDRSIAAYARFCCGYVLRLEARQSAWVAFGVYCQSLRS
jgi:hypothetical protein